MSKQENFWEPGAFLWVFLISNLDLLFLFPFRMEQQHWSTLLAVVGTQTGDGFYLTGTQGCLQGEAGCSTEVSPLLCWLGMHHPRAQTCLCLGSQSALRHITQHEHFVRSKQFCLHRSLCLMVHKDWFYWLALKCCSLPIFAYSKKGSAC